MLDDVKDALYRVITSPRGDAWAPLRLPKDLARRLNATLGSPLAPRSELTKRTLARERLHSLRARHGEASPRDAAPPRESAPVMVYFEKDRNARELARIEETLAARAVAYKLLDVTGDETTLDFVMREARCERDDLPVVFVGAAAIGTFPALVAADASGELEKALYT